MTVEEIQEQSTVHLNDLQSGTDKLYDTIESICLGHSSVGELDDAYKAVKETSKALNKLAKEYRKIKDKEEKVNEDDHAQ